MDALDLGPRSPGARLIVVPADQIAAVERERAQ